MLCGMKYQPGVLFHLYEDKVDYNQNQTIFHFPDHISFFSPIRLFAKKTEVMLQYYVIMLITKHRLPVTGTFFITHV